MNQPILTLGWFQLESLIYTRAPFLFLDVRVAPRSVGSARVQACLDVAHVVSASHLTAWLETQPTPKSHPIVLICEDGRLSWSQAVQLQSLGFTQVYVIEGGLDGLLQEVDDLSG